jgi:ferredoxin-NADP reductase
MNVGMETSRFSARVQEVVSESECVRSYLLRPAGDDRFPAAGAGAHIDLHLGNDLVRSYSLCGKPGDVDAYRIAVSLEESGRGGSKYVFESLAPGVLIDIGGPRNNFALNESAAHSILVAGGIGITPLWSMAQRLAQLGRSWTLYYAARSLKTAAFVPHLQELAELTNGRVVISVADDPQRQRFDWRQIARAAPAGTHFYCCGPAPMVAAFSQALDHLPPNQVHVEYFNGAAPATDGKGFTVELAQSSKIVQVKPGQSILDALQAIGVEVSHACKEGVCAACETRVLQGTPDHRDLVLSKKEKADNKSMMICCSGALSETLVLDL